MSDAKYFTRGKVQELRAELNEDKKDPKHTKKRIALKKIVANMTMGTDMAALYPDVLACMQVPIVEIKKMVYLYLINYAKTAPDLAVMAINSFVKDATDYNPLIRALALRTMSYMDNSKVLASLSEVLRHALKDQDPYVRKTAAICIAKMWGYDRPLVRNEGFLQSLKDLLNDNNPTVVANAVAALTEIWESDDTLEAAISVSTASKLLTALQECNEWGQTAILDAMIYVTPAQDGDAEMIAERVTSRLQHANAGVVLSSVKIVLYMLNYISRESEAQALLRKLAPPLVTLLHSQPEVQYVALRNIMLIIQRYPDLLKSDMKVFFCKYNDPIYVKLAKLEIMMRLLTEESVDQCLMEWKEYAAEVDVDFVRKSVRSIGLCAVKIEKSAERCVSVLLELIQTKVNYVVQEAIVVIKDIFRKYPNRYESIIGHLCENLDNLDEPEAKASMIWIIGHYADRIENAAELLETFLETFVEETAQVQLALLTATVKLFIRRPKSAQEIMPRVLKWATEVDNPDLRDRAYIYWRLLSHDPAAAAQIVFAQRPPITADTAQIDSILLQELLLHVSSLAALYHKPPVAFLESARRRQVQSSALLTETSRAMQQSGFGDDVSNPTTQVSAMNPYALSDAAPARARVMNLLDLDEPEEPVIQLQDLQQQSQMQQIPSTQQQLQYQPQSMDLLDPLSSNIQSLSNGLGQISLGSVMTSYADGKKSWLMAAQGRGLEIVGTFARRQGQPVMDMTFINRSLAPMTDFAIQFNKNAFGLQPAFPIQVRSPLMPESRAEVILPLSHSGPNEPLQPLNALQVAVKVGPGVVYFQTLVPLYALFMEDGLLDKSTFLQLWRDMPPQQEKTFQAPIAVLQSQSPENMVAVLSRKLAANNIFVVADRQVEQMVVIYASMKLYNNVTILLECTVNPSTAVNGAPVQGAVRTFASSLTLLLIESLIAILGSS